jgi:carbonic anhydrase/acetyltransferase-like protein (isoleucine patch superfamily)
MPIYALGDWTPELPADGDYWIAPTAVVIGRVRLKPGASVWWGAVLRGDNEWIEIGEETNVQDNSVLHTDIGAPLTVGRGCTIGHMVILHGCSVGDNALIGMGSTVLNNARIGSNVLIGANALVTENTEVPDGSLAVGAPAKVRRELDAAAIGGLRESAAGYAANWRRYHRELRPL